MKITVALNRRHDVTTLLNAVGHACLGLAHQARAESLVLRDFRDAQDWTVSRMTDFPLVVMSARSSAHLAEAHAQARDEGVPCNAFFAVMKYGSPDEQEALIRREAAAAQDYVALAMFGDDEALRRIARRFSLYRQEVPA